MILLGLRLDYELVCEDLLLYGLWPIWGYVVCLWSLLVFLFWMGFTVSLELWYSGIRFLIVFAGLKCLTVFCCEIGCAFVGLLVTLQVAGFYSVQIQVRVC